MYRSFIVGAITSLSGAIRLERSESAELDFHQVFDYVGTCMQYHIVEFDPPGKPWSTNEDRTLNPYKRAERILDWKTAASLAWTSHCNRRRAGRGLGPSLIRIEIPFAVRRRRDPHNYCGTVGKAIIDGFVLAGAWPDDTPEFVEHLPPTLHVGVWPKESLSTFTKGEMFRFYASTDPEANAMRIVLEE